MQTFAITDRIIAPTGVPDRVMEVFRMFSRFSPLSCWVSKDGKQMHYRIMRPARRSMFGERCQAYLEQARLVINVFQLPLHAEIDRNEMEGVIIQATLILKYTGE